MKVSLCIISTKSYKKFVQPLLDSVNKFFLIDHEIKVHLFTDLWGKYETTGRVKVMLHTIPSWGYPTATLYRYKCITGRTKAIYGEYLFYVDSDSMFVDFVGNEILGDVVAVRHPGYYAKNGWGSKNNNPKSTSFLPEEKWGKYFCGGFQGGLTKKIFPIMQEMRRGIEIDESNGIRAEWNDENFWNHHLADHSPTVELTPDYMLPESVKKRIDWGIDSFKPKILALEKDLKTHWVA